MGPYTARSCVPQAFVGPPRLAARAARAAHAVLPCAAPQVDAPALSPGPFQEGPDTFNESDMTVREPTLYMHIVGHTQYGAYAHHGALRTLWSCVIMELHNNAAKLWSRVQSTP